ELALAAAVVTVGWSGYFVTLLATLGIELPPAIAGEAGLINLPAVLIVLLLTAVLIAGIRISSRVNLALVIVKVGVVLLVIVGGAFFIDTANYTPFIPAPRQTQGVSGTGAP